MDKNSILETGRHSLAHVLAKAVCILFEDVKLGIGPAIDDGFYYDFDLPHTLNEDDFAKIEDKMREIINNNEEFTLFEVSNFEQEFDGQPYKLELSREFLEAGEKLTAYSTGEGFYDLCAGPHVQNTKELRNWGFCVASVAGAYWRGDSTKPMLQRIYCHAFATRPELKKYHQFLEEAKKRDHRVLGNQLDLFFFDETAPAMPYWLPKGLALYRTLLEFSQKTHAERGYLEMSGPQLNSRKLWETSGHWEHYQDNMYIIELENEQAFALKPMNCPNAMIAYGRKSRSYRDLPLRYFETSIIHRKEASGTFHGLFRVQAFRQDDSHNFISNEQIYDEINHILDISDYLYDTFGLGYRPTLSTRPKEGYLGNIADWDNAEEQLRQVLNRRYGEGNYQINEGDGAFYGPKIDMMVKDVLEREWQCCTIQLDFQLAGKFGLKYADQSGALKTPVVVHRALFGSLERFLGIMIEHFAARFPFWLSPLQVGIVPVHEKHIEYAEKIRRQLYSHGIKAHVDTTEGTMGNKIKSFRHELVPYILILGDKELEDDTISLRVRTGKQINGISLQDFLEKAIDMLQNRSLELTEEF